MSTADRLMELIPSWIEQREICADQLRNLAGELESLREKCNVGECVGSSVAVLGAACLIGSGVLTLLTAGAAAPVLAGLGATYAGVGATISVTTKIIEGFSSSDTMKDAKKVEERSNKIVDEIQQLFKKLKDEAKAANPFANPDELDRHITAEILTAMGRTSGVRGGVSIRWFNGEPQMFLDGGSTVLRVNKTLTSLVIPAVAGVLSFFTFQLSGKEFQPLFAEGVKQLVKRASTTACKTVLKGGAKVVGGAVGMAFALPEAIDNWTEMIKKNHVTEASQSLRDTANAIRQVTQMLREQLDSTRRMLDEMAKRQREREEKRKRKEEERRKEEEKRKKRSPKVFFVVTVHLNSSAYHSHGHNESPDKCQHHETYKNGQEGGGYEWSSKKERDSGQSIKTGGQAPGGDDPGGDDPGDKKSDSEDEESSQTDEESSSDEETEDEDSRPRIIIDLSKKVSMALLNVHSIKNKLSPVSDLINEYQLQVLFLTETWLRTDTGDDVLREGLPEGLQFFQQPRGSRGGGVAIVFSEELEAEPISLGSYTFEYLAVVMNHQGWHQPMLTITLYRRPGYNVNKFLEEFQSLLNVSKLYESIQVIGDFNIWVDVENRRPTRRFRKFLEDNGFHHHVKGPTSTRSKHTLDLIISRNVDVSDVFIQDKKISDHKTVFFSASPEEEEEKKKKREMDQDNQTKQFRKSQK